MQRTRHSWPVPGCVLLGAAIHMSVRVLAVSWVTGDSDAVVIHMIFLSPATGADPGICKHLCCFLWPTECLRVQDN